MKIEEMTDFCPEEVHRKEKNRKLIFRFTRIFDAEKGPLMGIKTAFSIFQARPSLANQKLYKARDAL